MFSPTKGLAPAMTPRNDYMVVQRTNPDESEMYRHPYVVLKSACYFAIAGVHGITVNTSVPPKPRPSNDPPPHPIDPYGSRASQSIPAIDFKSLNPTQPQAAAGMRRASDSSSKGASLIATANTWSQNPSTPEVFTAHYKLQK